MALGGGHLGSGFDGAGCCVWVWGCGMAGVEVTRDGYGLRIG